MSVKLKDAKQSQEMKDKVEALGKVSIWYAYCRRCKTKLRGHIDDLRAHTCGKTS